MGSTQLRRGLSAGMVELFAWFFWNREMPLPCRRRRAAASAAAEGVGEAAEFGAGVARWLLGEAVSRPDNARWVGVLPRRGRAVVVVLVRRVVAWDTDRLRLPPRGAGVVLTCTFNSGGVLLINEGKVGFGLATFLA